MASIATPAKFTKADAKAAYKSYNDQVVADLKSAAVIVKKVYGLPDGQSFQLTDGTILTKTDASRAMTAAIAAVADLTKRYKDIQELRVTKRAPTVGGSKGFSKAQYWSDAVVGFFQEANLGMAADGASNLNQYLSFIGGGASGGTPTKRTSRAMLNPLFAIYARNAQLSNNSAINQRIAAGEKIQKFNKKGEAVTKDRKVGGQTVKEPVYETVSTGRLGADPLMNKWFGNSWARVTAKSLADGKAPFNPQDFKHANFQQVLAVEDVTPAEGSPEAEAINLDTVDSAVLATYDQLAGNAKAQQAAQLNLAETAWKALPAAQKKLTPKPEPLEINYAAAVQAPFEGQYGSLNAYPALFNARYLLDVEQQIVSMANRAAGRK